MRTQQASIFLFCGFFALLMACHGTPGARLGFKRSSSSDHQARGAVEGESSPPLADCYAHCELAFQQEPDSKVASEEQVRDYAFGCVSHCVVARSKRVGLQCYGAMAADSADEWQELYLARALVEKTVFCAREAGDTSPQGQALIAAVIAEQATNAAKKANALEREALLSRDPALAKFARKMRRIANASSEWQTALSAFQRWTAPEELAVPLLTCVDALPLRACGQATF